MILAGIWCGRNKPVIEVFARLFVDEVQRLSYEGIVISVIAVIADGQDLSCILTSTVATAAPAYIVVRSHVTSSLIRHIGMLSLTMGKSPLLQ